MFNRLRLEGAKTKADVVVGIDNFLQPEAEKSGLFAEFEAKTKLETQQKIFFPYDTGSYAFIYDKEKLKNPPKSLKRVGGTPRFKSDLPRPTYQQRWAGLLNVGKSSVWR